MRTAPGGGVLPDNARMSSLTHLQRLEAESIDILREAVAVDLREPHDQAVGR